jgi:hypothetical protein
MANMLSSSDLADLSSARLREILTMLGDTAVIYTSKENKLAKTQQGSMRTRITEKLAELQAKYGGAILTPKGSLVDGPAKEEFVAWYLEQRKEDVLNKPDKDYKQWALVHLADTLKHRKESVRALEPATV